MRADGRRTWLTRGPPVMDVSEVSLSCNARSQRWRRVGGSSAPSSCAPLHKLPRPQSSVLVSTSPKLTSHSSCTVETCLFQLTLIPLRSELVTIAIHSHCRHHLLLFTEHFVTNIGLNIYIILSNLILVIIS